MRASFSPLLSLSADLSCAILDSAGEVAAQGNDMLCIIDELTRESLATRVARKLKGTHRSVARRPISDLYVPAVHC